MEKAEERTNTIEFELTCYIPMEDYTEAARFTIQTWSNDQNKVMISYNKATWTQPKGSKYVFKICKIIMRQMLRDITKALDTNIYDVSIGINVLWNNEKLFTDECYVDDRIHAIDMALHNMDDCNQNDSLCAMQDMLVGYVELALNMGVN